MGRKSKYEENCVPRLEEIKQWASAGATDEEIAEVLDISLSTLYEYKLKHPEFAEAFKRGRKQVVIEIKNALLKKALGFYYEEKEQSVKQNDDGDEIIYTRIHKRYCVPSETAGAMLLRNYDEDWRDSDNTTAKLKKQEHELRKKIAENNNW